MKNRKQLLILSICLVIVAFISIRVMSPSSQRLPTEDGVYAELANGSFVQLRPIAHSLVILSGRGDDDIVNNSGVFTHVRRTIVGLETATPERDFMTCLATWAVEQSEISDLTPIPWSDIKSVVIRSPVRYTAIFMRGLTTLDAIKETLVDRQGTEGTRSPQEAIPALQLLGNPRYQHLQNCHGRPGQHLNVADGRPEFFVDRRSWSTATETIDELFTRFTVNPSDDFSAMASSRPSRMLGFDGELLWPNQGGLIFVQGSNQAQIYFLGR